MKIFLVLFSLVFSLGASAAITPSPVPSIGLGFAGSFGPTTLVSPSQLVTGSSKQIFSLYAGANASNGNFYPLYKNGTAYQVPVGKTAYCFNFNPSAATGAIRFQVVSDTVAIAFDQVAALTSGLFQGGATARYVLRNSPTANAKQVSAGVFSIAASRYVAVQVGFSDIFEFTMDCFEE